jgi:putative transcriptional regulator
MPQPHAGPVHHIHDDLLMDYAAGVCGEAEALIIASHLALCPECRVAVRDLERMGGAMLVEVEPAEMSAGSFAAVLGRIDGLAPEPPPRRAPVTRPAEHGRIVVPEPLRGYLGGDLDAVRWKPVIRGLDEFALPTAGANTKLLRIRAGVTMPRHTHSGQELTLVLTGGFSDERGHFQRGDFTVNDSSVDHRPVADEDGDCICLAVVDKPLKLTGALGRLLNPFVRF